MAAMDMQVECSSCSQLLVWLLGLIKRALCPNSRSGMWAVRTDMDSLDLNNSWCQWWNEQSEAEPVDFNAW